jgi:hypothetical protein
LASAGQVVVQLVNPEIASHTVRKIAYNLSNNYDGDLLNEEQVEIEEEI